jgi:hypothetical protein
MNLLSWNCRGLGNPQAVRDLCQLTKEKKPTILFLMETKCHRNKMEFVRVKLGFECLFVVDSVGRSGGLALLWNDKELVEIQNYSRRHINAIVKGRDSVGSWKLTGFYGHPDWTKRHESWALLNHLRSFAPLPWLCVGDFNEITAQSEKTGVVLRKESQMSQFRDVLEDCHFSDLGFTGSKYTWTNCRQDESFIKERLDRAVANISWIQLYKKVEVRILAARTSDHKPLLISFTNMEEKGRQFQGGGKFEVKWLADEESREIITNAWNDGVGGDSSIQVVQHKLETCKSALRRWNGQKYGCAEKAIKKKTKELEILQKNESVMDGLEIKKLQQEIDFLLEQEDLRWKQRAKQNWYRQGDKNTPYFHAWASHRRKVNQIQKIQDDDGRIWEKPDEISKSFLDFYQNLFMTSGVHGVEECLLGLETRVTDVMNGDLLKTFNMVEVDVALQQMHPLKSPGPDGMSACFYQTAWPTVRHEVGSAVLDFLNGGSFEATINATYIALIPKIKNPSRITEYRPISLCNVIYKLIAKVLANRLKKVLPHIISANQSAFVPGRLITDNVLVAFEALQTMDVRMKGKAGYMALKLDMSKAYDRVEWDFLEAVMLKIGFASRWVEILMVCIRTVSYSILINGQPHGQIVPTRGIRQGDPLSPYLFILCAEGLSTMLRRAELAGRITGLPIKRGGTRISHLFFADDSLLFCRSSILEWARIQELLEIYERASGQKLNWEKTSIFFSKNTKREAKEFILSTAGVTSSAHYESYLGLPALIGRSKVSSFSVVKGRIWERMNGWKEKFLSQAGKEVLLKAVVQAIPTYTMSVFQLPKTLCKEICSMMSKFWWGHKGNDARIAWMQWSKMGRAKEKGGLGFRDLELFNLALLAK